MDSTTAVIADHYQKTFELTMQTWEKRNRTFLILLGVVGLGALLTWNPEGSQPLFVDIVLKLIGIADAERSAALRDSFPFSLMQSVLLVVVAYLTIVLYHRTATIQRHYKYLAVLENDLRGRLSLTSESSVFTREGDFYQAHKPAMGRYVAISYVAMLGSLLAAFLGYRIFQDFASGNLLVGGADVLLTIPTLLFFYGYAKQS